MKGTADGESHCALRAEFFRSYRGSVKRPMISGNDDLAGRVVVGNPRVAIGATTRSISVIIVEAEDCNHRARAEVCGILHRLATDSHDADTIIEAQRPNCG